MKRALLASGVALLFGFVAGSSILRPLSMLRESYSSSTKDKITFRPVLQSEAPRDTAVALHHFGSPHYAVHLASFLSAAFSRKSAARCAFCQSLTLRESGSSQRAVIVSGLTDSTVPSEQPYQM